MPLAIPAWRRTREPRAAIISSPSPIGRIVTSSPGRRPAARIASTGSVTWFLDETLAMPLLYHDKSKGEPTPARWSAPHSDALDGPGVPAPAGDDYGRDGVGDG